AHRELEPILQAVRCTALCLLLQSGRARAASVTRTIRRERIEAEIREALAFTLGAHTFVGPHQLTHVPDRARPTSVPDRARSRPNRRVSSIARYEAHTPSTTTRSILPTSRCASSSVGFADPPRELIRSFSISLTPSCSRQSSSAAESPVYVTCPACGISHRAAEARARNSDVGRSCAGANAPNRINAPHARVTERILIGVVSRRAHRHARRRILTG